MGSAASIIGSFGLRKAADGWISDGWISDGCISNRYISNRYISDGAFLMGAFEDINQRSSTMHNAVPIPPLFFFFFF